MWCCHETEPSFANISAAQARASEGVVPRSPVKTALESGNEEKCGQQTSLRIRGAMAAPIETLSG